MTDKHAFAFYTDIEDNCQRWRENYVDFALTLWVKNFVKIALFLSVSEINMFFFVLHRNSRWPPTVA